MNRLFTLPTHPLRLLAYLEWILLGFAALTALIIPTLHPNREPSWLSLLAVAVFALLGLWPPAKIRWQKVMYTAVEIGLILLPLAVSDRFRFMPILGLIAVIRGCRMFQLPGRLMVASSVFGTFLVSLALQVPPPFAKPIRRPLSDSPDIIWVTLKLNAAVTFAFAILFILLLINALLAERQSREQLSLAHAQLHQYALRIEDQATLQERNRIAREIHDSLGHSLTAQSIQLENALMYLPTEPEKTRHYVTVAKQLGAQALREVRQSVATLRANPLQGKAFNQAIAALLDEFATTTGIQLQRDLQVPSLPLELSTALYRILQEALTNIQKHSQAQQVTVRLHSEGDRAHLEIIDNGHGFTPTQTTTGFGLQSMQERAIAVGGTFHLTSAPGQGCHITVTLPRLGLQP